MRPSVRKPAGASALVLACLVAVAPAAAYEIVSARTTPPRLLLYGPRAGLGMVHDSFNVGDIDGDGHADMVLGNAWLDVAGVRNAGEGFVVLGPFPEPTVRDLAVEPPEIVITGRQDMRVGEHVLVEDVNGDGFADVVVGAPMSGQRPIPGRLRGEVGILFGPLSPGTIDFTIQEADLWIHGAEDNDQIGGVMVLGDVNADGATDLLLGIPATRGGRIDVVLGPLAPGPVRDLSVQPPEVRLIGELDAEAFGSVIASGDISGDGTADICGTAPHYPFTAPEGLGEVRCVFGPFPSGRVVDMAVTPPEVRVRGRCEREGLARTIVIADLDGDGNGDLALATPDACGSAARDNAGVVLVERGPVAAGVIDQVTTHPDVVLRGTAGSKLGHRLVSAPWPGRAVLIVSAPLTEEHCGQGALHVVDPLPPDGTVMNLDLLGGSTVFSESEDRIGYQVAAIDIDGDGHPEVATVGSSDGPDGTRPACGRLILYREADRCEEPPPEIEEPILVTRSGNDVLVHFVPSGLEHDGIAVDLIRGFASEIGTGFPETVLSACNLRASPARDDGAAEAGRSNYYYLAARACPVACGHSRLIGSLGSGDAGPRRRPTPNPWVPGCP